MFVMHHLNHIFIYSYSTQYYWQYPLLLAAPGTIGSTQYYWQRPVLLAVLVGLEVLMMGYTVTAISPNNGHAMLNL